MRLLLFSDIHSDLRALQRHIDTEADYYLAAGDLVNWGRHLDKAGEILARKADRVGVIPGNHESEQDIAEVCSRYGLANLHGRSLELGGYHVAALGYSNRTPFGTPGEYSEEEIASRLAPFAALHPLVLVCHCPPKETALDRAGEGRHFGSTAVREFVDRTQPDYFFCGHIHEAEGVETTLGRTRAINVGKRGYLLEL
jgi:Icc-related predicted phosphoesterase